MTVAEVIVVRPQDRENICIKAYFPFSLVFYFILAASSHGVFQWRYEWESEANSVFAPFNKNVATQCASVPKAPTTEKSSYGHWI